MEEDIFNCEELISLLDEMVENKDSQTTSQEPDYYSGMVKIAASAISEFGDDDGEWNGDVIKDALDSTLNNANVSVKHSIEEFSEEKYCDAQLEEIRLGVAHHVDVDLYADPLMNYKQMREIRYGLERGLKVFHYNNRLFSYKKMREIRLGLRDELDVEQYARIVYSVSDMKAKRRELFSQKYDGRLDSLYYEYKDADTGITVYAEYGLMEGGIVLSRKLPDTFTRDSLKELIKAYDFSKGFDERLVPRNLSNLPLNVKIPIMSGVKPTTGKDGWYEYEFERVGCNKPVVNEDGSVNYTPPQKYISVERGETVAIYHPPTLGKDGMTITGMPVKAYLGTEPEPLKSDDLIMSRDKSYYMSKKKGFITFVGDYIRIMDTLVMDKDISWMDGVIEYKGTIEIRGTIHEKVRINATADIIVTGHVEGAFLTAGGNIIVKGGVNADNEGALVAKGDIVSSFFENANVVAGGNVETGYILNSNVTAEGTVLIKGKKALICGGTVVGRNGITAGLVGSPSGARTVLVVGTDGSAEKARYVKLLSESQAIDEDVKKVRTIMELMIQKMGPVVARQDPQFMKLQKTVVQRNEEKNAIRLQLTELDAQRLKRETLYLTVNNTLFENTLVCINDNKMLVGEREGRGVFKCSGRYIIRME